jgi:hypothetical protein
MNLFFDIFDTAKTPNTIMTSISLRKIPDELHREIKRLQLDMEDRNIKKSLEEIYIELIEKGLEITKQENPTN